MTFPLYFFISLLVKSPWPILYTIIFYYVYIFDTTFDYYITKKRQLRKYWLVVAILPIFCTNIFLLRYNRMGLSLDLFMPKDICIAIIEPLSWLDISFIGIFIFLIKICGLMTLRCSYQYYRKCCLALYVYYYQYKKVEDFYTTKFLFYHYYNAYLIRRVKIFTKGLLAFRIAKFIWPTSTNILERNLYHFIVPYLVLFDMIIQKGVITKIFLNLLWYYIYIL